MRWRPELAVGALFLAGAGQAAPLLDEMLRERDFLCELRAGDPGQRDRARTLMVFIEGMQAGSASVYQSNLSGMRRVRVYGGDTGVHFVEDLPGSVRVTSVLSCLRWRDANDNPGAGNGAGARKCQRYEAVNRWHFDLSVHQNADQAFLRLAENSWAGWCEPWRLN